MALPDTCLTDSNILLRLNQQNDPDHKVVKAVIETLREAGSLLYYTHQNVSEVWNVATRPANRNGLGLSLAEVKVMIYEIERDLVFLADSEDVYREWRRLIEDHAVVGVQVHDAKLVAAMIVHGVKHLLTLNIRDFARYPQITAIHPREIAFPSARS